MTVEEVCVFIEAAGTGGSARDSKGKEGRRGRREGWGGRGIQQ
jgi:hypothetical protein